MEKGDKVDRDHLYAQFKKFVDHVKTTEGLPAAFQTGNKDVIDPVLENWFNDIKDG